MAKPLNLQKNIHYRSAKSAYRDGLRIRSITETTKEWAVVDMITSDGSTHRYISHTIAELVRWLGPERYDFYKHKKQN